MPRLVRGKFTFDSSSTGKLNDATNINSERSGNGQDCFAYQARTRNRFSAQPGIAEQADRQPPFDQRDDSTSSPDVNFRKAWRGQSPGVDSFCLSIWPDLSQRS